MYVFANRSLLFSAGLFLSKKILDVDSELEQINFEKAYLLCKDLPANPCREMLAGGRKPTVKQAFQA
jgi:hypothetical protein